jgi:predicted KAP-like P-loop ATPase
MHQISSDRPDLTPNTDLFGHAPFAKELAKSICNYDSSDGLVLALHGPWGAGKSTVLNYVKHYVEQVAEAERPIIVDFNPWWFSGQENLAKAFLGQLQLVLPQKYKAFKDVGYKLSEFSDGIGGLVELAGAPSWLAGLIGKGVKLAAKKPKDVPQLKADISKLLREKKKRILIIVDDIDRLTAEEVRQLFTVVKALADFPYMTYLLAFDKEVATQAIEQQTGLPGDRFLEKIIQVPFELPLIDRADLRKALFSRLDQILGEADSLFDQEHWTNIFFAGIDPLFKVPRDVVRFTNTLAVTYPAVRGEVNPVDFIAIEAIRVFLPALYDVLRSNSSYFVGIKADGNWIDGTQQREQSFTQLWKSTIPESLCDSTSDLLVRLFPKLSDTLYGHEFLSQWRQQAHICHPDILPLCFRLSIKSGQTSRAEMLKLVEIGNDNSEIAKYLLEASTQKNSDGTSKARALLERFLDHIEKDIEQQHVKNYISSLFNIGDQLVIESDKVGMYDFSNGVRITRVVRALLRRINKADRLLVLTSAFEHGLALDTQMDAIASIVSRSEKPDQSEDVYYFEEVDINKLKTAWIKKIQIAAKNGLIEDHKNLPSLLKGWGNWGANDEIKDWVATLTTADEKLVKFIDKFLVRNKSQTVGDHAIRDNPRLNPKWLNDYLDAEKVVTRLNALVTNNSTLIRNNVAVTQLLKEYEALKLGQVYSED